MVTTRNCAGKLVGSATPSSPRKKASWPNVFAKAPPKQALDHTSMP